MEWNSAVLVLLFGPCFIELLRDEIGKCLLFSPWTFGRRCCCSKGLDFPMHFKRLGFCDFWIVKGYMCKKDVAGDQNSANADTCSAPALPASGTVFFSHHSNINF